MKNKFTRLTAFLVIVILVFSLLITRLAYLQVVNGDYYSEIAEAMGEKPKMILAPRGEILDTNHKKIATNRLGYSIVYTAPKKKLASDELNKTIVHALNMIYKHNEQGKIVTASMPVSYDFALQKPSLKTKSLDKLSLLKYARSISKSNKLNASFENSFSEELVSTISKSIDDLEKVSETLLKEETKKVEGQPNSEEIIEGLKNKSDASLKEEIRKIEEQQMSSFNPEKAAWEILYRLAEKYGLGTISDQENLVFENTYGLKENNKEEKLYYAVSLRYNLKSSEFRQYEDIELVKNVSQEAAWEFQIRSTEMTGISAQIIPIRQYPYGEVGSAFLGYLGKVSESQKEKYERLGYDISRELVGRYNLEYRLENRENNDMDIQLRGEPGVKFLKVDKFGKVIEETGSIEPVPGDTVVLSINMDMQEAAERSLDEVMAKIRQGPSAGISKESYPAYRGAVVAMNIHTGEVLALASRPGFNPNDFAEAGLPSDPLILEKYLMTAEGKKKVAEDEKSNAYVLPNPMFNYATQGVAMPGSIFKAFTSIAGLEEGVITPTTEIYDKVAYPVGGNKVIRCWIAGRGTHGSINVTEALKVSCNYFFNEVGRRLGNDRFSEWARKFGIARDEFNRRPSTGIEISESTGVVGTPEDARRNEAYVKLRKLEATLQKAENGSYDISGEPGIRYEILNMLVDGFYDEKKLDEIGISNKSAKRQIKNQVDQMKNVGTANYQVLYMSMGQGGVALTPLQMAQVTSTIVNGGTRYKAQLVKKVLNPDGTVKREIQPEVLNELNLNPDYVTAIKVGMGKVTEEPGGTATRVFKSYPIQTGGKTGTAQPGVQAHPQRANYAWFSGIAPYAPADKAKGTPEIPPEIVVVVVIYDGGSGGYSGYVAREVYDAYFKTHPKYKDDPGFIDWLNNKNTNN